MRYIVPVEYVVEAGTELAADEAVRAQLNRDDEEAGLYGEPRLDFIIRTPRLDIWHDDEGVWRQIGTQTYGPFETEALAEAFQPKEGE